MNKFGKRSLALLLCAGLGASMLTGCGKKAAAADMFTYNGEAVDNKVATLLFRLQEASFDEVYGNMFAQYYGGQNVWEMDLSGQGELYGDTFKNDYKELLEKLMIAQEHAADYDIRLSDDEEKKIADAADKFIADNDQATLEAMSADKDTVVKVLELQTIQRKVEDKIEETVDTEVSDEEAAQRTISYICYTPTTETESEAESEGVSEAGTEADAENEEDVLSAETETAETAAAETEAETTVTPEAAESETAVVETEKSDKTGSADTEAQTDIMLSETEEETETESPEMQAAREKFRQMAVDKFHEIGMSGKDFSEYMDEVNQNMKPGISAATISFGKDDSYPAPEIIEATNDLEDNTLVDHIVLADGNYYIIHVDKKLDQEKTDEKKEQIVEQRKYDAVEAQYTDWEKDAKFETDEEAYAELKFDRAYVAPPAPQTEAEEAFAETEAAAAETEAATEA